MEYDTLRDTVQRITDGAVGEYSDLMNRETDALRVAERIADDKRDTDIAAGSLWNTPLSRVASEFVEFWKEIYNMVMNEQGDAAMRRMLTPDGLVCGGIALLIITLTLTLLRV